MAVSLGKHLSRSLRMTMESSGGSKARIAYVRYRQGETQLRLQIQVGGAMKTLLRPADGKLGKFRSRLQALAAQVVDAAENGSAPSIRRKRQTVGASTEIELKFLTSSGDEVADDSVTVGEALLRTETIVIGEETYAVLHNQPMVARISVMNPVLEGIPIAPLAETEFCSAEDCVWSWFRLDVNEQETLVADSWRFVPTEHDVGCRLRIECRAPMGSPVSEASVAELVTAPVVRQPDRPVFEKRVELGASTAQPSGSGSNAFRVMTYNVLYDGYARNAKTKMSVFPYISGEAPSEAYRMQLVFREIREANADVVCLQEMGGNIFQSFFEPNLRPLGYQTIYTGEMGTTLEGCAMVIRAHCFDVVEQKTLTVSQEVLNSQDPGIQALLSAYPELAIGLKKIPSIAQIITLRDKRDRRRHLLVINTHLYYREDADVIRSLQTVATVRAIERHQSMLESSGHRVAVLFCGDLNSAPDSSAIRFLLDGRFDETHRHWQEVRDFVWDRSTSSESTKTSPEAAWPASISHSLELISACGVPEFTNYAATSGKVFVATLDYIFFGGRDLEVTQTFPMFTREQATLETALPSPVFPSDHVSLIADLQWKSR